MTYRRPENPRAQITARIADKTHTVRVAFDVEATDEFERSARPGIIFWPALTPGADPNTANNQNRSRRTSAQSSS